MYTDWGELDAVEGGTQTLKTYHIKDIESAFPCKEKLPIHDSLEKAQKHEVGPNKSGNIILYSLIVTLLGIRSYYLYNYLKKHYDEYIASKKMDSNNSDEEVQIITDTNVVGKIKDTVDALED